MLEKARFVAHAAVASLTAALAVFSGCSGESATGVKPNPKWLRQCDADAVCGTGLACLCGICTLECRIDGDCATLGDTATCLIDARLASACLVNGLCTGSAALPDASLGGGGSSGMGSGGRGSGAVAGESSNGGAIIVVSAGGASTAGRGNGGNAVDGGSVRDASSGELDAGPLRDASRADGGTESCARQVDGQIDCGARVP